MYCIKAVVCRLYQMLYPCICNVVISCWKPGAYDFVICRGGTDMCFVPRSGWKHLDLEQYRISGLTTGVTLRRSDLQGGVHLVREHPTEAIRHKVAHPSAINREVIRQTVSYVRRALEPNPNVLMHGA